ncbi:VOC family protein [Halobacteria archaeon AArc-m2/3/4]|uniref:VOC family protein n=1 Tax=Natronoglomus mannanivorans TaxID=2979990 RepID=A0ABT2QHJ9_9EURY|nr:VOC family protein [Halobacteria archaeon AArc-m2/3/4]
MPDTDTDLRAHHVGITVSDLEESLEFYRDVLGLSVLDRFTVSGDAFATGVGVDGATGTFAHLDADGARIELIEYDPDGPSCTAESVNQTGAKHVGFAVADLEAFHDDLPEAVETLSEPQTTASDTSILFLRDPEGNLIEVIEG